MVFACCTDAVMLDGINQLAENPSHLYIPFRIVPDAHLKSQISNLQILIAGAKPISLPALPTLQTIVDPVLLFHFPFW